MAFYPAPLPTGELILGFVLAYMKNGSKRRNGPGVNSSIENKVGKGNSPHTEWTWKQAGWQPFGNSSQRTWAGRDSESWSNVKSHMRERFGIVSCKRVCMLSGCWVWNVALENERQGDDIDPGRHGCTATRSLIPTSRSGGNRYPPTESRASRYTTTLSRVYLYNASSGQFSSRYGGTHLDPSRRAQVYGSLAFGTGPGLHNRVIIMFNLPLAVVGVVQWPQREHGEVEDEPDSSQCHLNAGPTIRSFKNECRPSSTDKSSPYHAVKAGILPSFHYRNQLLRPMYVHPQRVKRRTRTSRMAPSTPITDTVSAVWKYNTSRCGEMEPGMHDTVVASMPTPVPTPVSAVSLDTQHQPLTPFKTFARDSTT
ncbi:hypothetical protein BDN72DRAFT_863972 [Pluteus cervinus]|uniref:Uncharacterized protein n=1 Tax=Pluteus cervinus TaxID=181527 RepID=A0ACD3A6D5_9AGAR|nr:hypothetical protein BDN72DRAFT_863972 [Pluteus cervinus]